MGMRYRIRDKDSPEMANLWAWSNQFKGPPGWVGMDLQVMRRHNAIGQEVEALGGKWTNRGNFAFPTKEQMTFFKLKWG